MIGDPGTAGDADTTPGAGPDSGVTGGGGETVGPRVTGGADATAQDDSKVSARLASTLAAQFSVIPA